MRKVAIAAALLFGFMYAGVKEEVEDDIYECALKDFSGEFSIFDGNNASVVKMVCSSCASELHDRYDLEDQITKKSYLDTYDVASEACNKELVKKIYTKVKKQNSIHTPLVLDKE